MNRVSESFLVIGISIVVMGHTAWGAPRPKEAPGDPTGTWAVTQVLEPGTKDEERRQFRFALEKIDSVWAVRLLHGRRDTQVDEVRAHEGKVSFRVRGPSMSREYAGTLGGGLLKGRFHIFLSSGTWEATRESTDADGDVKNFLGLVIAGIEKKGDGKWAHFDGQ